MLKDAFDNFLLRAHYCRRSPAGLFSVRLDGLVFPATRDRLPGYDCHLYGRCDNGDTSPKRTSLFGGAAGEARGAYRPLAAAELWRPALQRIEPPPSRYTWRRCSTAVCWSLGNNPSL